MHKEMSAYKELYYLAFNCEFAPIDDYTKQFNEICS